MKKSTKQKASRYSEAQTTRWLSWMAKNMQRHKQTVFLIEDLQVSWLNHNWERKLHWASSIIFCGLLGGLMIGLTSGLIVEPIYGFLVGLTFGLIVGLIFSVGKNSQTIATTESTHWSWKNLRSNYKAGLKTGAFRGLIFGLIAGLFSGPIIGFREGLSEGLTIGLTNVLIGGFFGGLFGLFAAGVGNIVSPTTTIPNEGIKLTLKSSLNGLISGLIFGLIFQWLFFELTDRLIFGLVFDLAEMPIDRLEDWLIVGLVSALIGGLWFGGIAVIRHYTLRLLIYLRGYGPWNYVAFLDCAADELQFLQRVGGGYIFIHRMLLEHFAGMEDDKAPANDEMKASDYAFPFKR